MRKTRVIPEREKKPRLNSYSRFASSKDLPSTEPTPNILHTIDYDKKLIKQLLNNNQ